MVATLISIAILALAAAGAAERRGPWVDEIIVIEEPSDAAAISRLEVKDIDVYAYTVSNPDIFERVLANPDLDYQISFGSYNELTFNPVGPVFPGTGKLNPFAVPKIREAMNILIDRDHISQEIYGGMAVPKFFPITAAFPDYARYAEICRVLELKYAHNPALADEIISAEMEKLGAKRILGEWIYEGEPVEIKLLIRNEDERKLIGDYIGNLLEGIGFEVSYDYRTAAEASPVWYSGDPAEGKFHIYTGGWITTVVARDQADNFDYFYTPRGLATPLWTAYEPAPEFDEVAEKLDRAEFKSMEERAELFSKALELCMEDSVRLWLIDQTSFAPHVAEVSVTADLAGSIAGSYLWPHTIRRGEEVGGTIRMAMPSILTEPWNPLDGTNWIYDMGLIRPTGDLGYMWDPYTGMHYPNKIEKADVFIQEDLPVSVTLDWVNVVRVAKNQVPEDAWIDWDPVAQRFITVGEKYPEGLTALRKTIAYYPDDLFETTKWHDGSPLSVADIVLGLILNWDRAMEESEFFDEAQVPSFETFQRTFRGVRITSLDPLVYEYYSDLYYLDAEWYVPTGYPYFAQGTAGWHNLGLGIKAEMAKEVAFSSDKASKAEVEWLSYIGGPSLKILEEQLEVIIADNWIPYSPTLSEYITPEEASARWENLKNWYDEKNHFWVGTGPFYLDKAYHLEKVVHLKRNEDYTFASGRWDIFSEPMIAEVEIFGDRTVQIGAEAVFEIEVTFEGEPYPTEYLDNIKYMIFDARGELAYVGQAEPIEDGYWEAVLPAEISAQLVVGSNRFEVAAVSVVVSIPTFESSEFVTHD